MDTKWDASMSSKDYSKRMFPEKNEQSLYGYQDSRVNIDNEDDMMPAPPAVPNIYTFSVPLFGRIQFVRDILGYIQWSVIAMYWLYGNWSVWLLILLPHYYDGQVSVVMLFIYATMSALCITSFLRVSTTNPGSLNNGQQPMEDWAICGKCCRRRPPMSHHCRRCGQCVRKMDHHCPWINNCVGEDNQYAFMLLVAYAYTLSLTTLVLTIMHKYYMPPCVSCDRESFMMRHETGILLATIIMAVLMTFGAAGLYMSQHISILFETPSIEWMRIQELYFTSGPSAITWPRQKKSLCGAYRATFGEGSCLLWPFPCRRRRFSVVSFHV